MEEIKKPFTFKEIEMLKNGGADEHDIALEQESRIKILSASGVPQQQIQEYIRPNIDDAAITTAIETDIKSYNEQDPNLRKSDSYWEDFMSGVQNSVSGLVARGKKPELILSEKSDTFGKILHGAGQIAGDLPAIIPSALSGAAFGGGFGGGIGTATLPIVGTVGGAAAGATIGAAVAGNALPESMRSVLLDGYENGSIKSFDDFWTRFSSIALKTTKAGTVGLVAGGAGAKVASMFGPTSSALTKTAVVTSAEAGSMVLAGAALEGHVPEPQDFTVATGTMALITAITHVAPVLKSAYKQEGIHPAELAKMAKENPALKEDIMSDNLPIPDAIDTKSVKVNTEKNIYFESEIDSFLKPEYIEAREYKSNQKDVPEIKKIDADADTSKMLEIIGEEKVDTFWQRLTSKEGKEKLYTNFVDDLHPIKVAEEMMTGKRVDDSNSAYGWMRTFRGSSGVVKHAFEEGMISFKDREVVSKPMDSIFEPIVSAGEINQFKAYAIAKRGLELHRRNIKTNIEKDAAERVVKNFSSKYQKQFEEFVDIQNKGLQYIVDSGRVSKESGQRILEISKDYINMSVIKDKKNSGKSNAVILKEIKGSTEKKVDFLRSAYSTMSTFIREAERNRSIGKFIDIAKNSDSIGEGKLIEKVSEKKKITLSSEELKKLGLDDSAESDISIFREKPVTVGDDVFVHFENGKPQYYRTTPEIVAAIKAMDISGSPDNFLLKLSQSITRLKKASISLKPEFQVSNFIRDIGTSQVLNKYKLTGPERNIPVLDAFNGIGDFFFKTDAYKAWLRSGGKDAHMLADDLFMPNKIEALEKETGVFSKTRNVIMRPIDTMNLISEIVESGPRIAAFKSKVGRNYDNLTIDKLVEAGYASRESTLDFAKMGAQMRVINANVAYSGVFFNSLDKIARAYKEDPAGFTGKAVATLTAPSIALWYHNQKDPRWDGISNWEKDTFWIIFTENHTFKVPKPPVVGQIFGSLPERTMEAFFKENPKAFKDFEDTIISTFSTNVLPDIIQVPIEHTANKSFFTGNKWVNDQIAQLAPAVQSTEYTHETSKALAKLISYIPGLKDIGPGNVTLSSPIVIENYVQGYLGGIGRYALSLLDTAGESIGYFDENVDPTPELEDIPFIKAFMIRYPSGSHQSIKDFYENEAKAKTIQATFKYLIKNNQTSEAISFLNESDVALQKLDGFKKTIGMHAHEVKKIYTNKTIPIDDKRGLINQRYSLMIEISKAGNKIFDDLNKAKSNIETGGKR